MKNKLNSTNQQTIDYLEGELSEEEYAPVKEQRKAWRAEINELEKQLAEVQG